MQLACILPWFENINTKSFKKQLNNAIRWSLIFLKMQKGVQKPYYILKIVKIAKIIFEMSPFCTSLINMKSIEAVCLRLQVEITFGASYMTSKRVSLDPKCLSFL